MWRILIAEDVFEARQLLVESLRELAQCDVVVTGKEAVNAYNVSLKNEKKYDLILLDIAMPEMDGMEVLHKIRESEEDAGILFGKGIPIIMVTAFNKPMVSAFGKGCDDYIVKPIDPDILIEKVKEKLEK
ncbi:MAG: response regulator [Candidatus Omnitrophica bacterium]|nr:response regulator [Candidatus Omnitrophota bacterium]